VPLSSTGQRKALVVVRNPMRTIPPNIIMLTIRVVLLALFIWMYQWPFEKIHKGSYDIGWAFFLGLAVYSLFPIYLLWTLLRPLWVRVAFDRQALEIYSLLGRKIICASDIEGYYKTCHNTKVKNYNGIIIKVAAGSVIELSEYNIRSIKPVLEFLAKANVPFCGRKDSWFPLTRRV
jgi:hypothetical protein